ncbi:unnamed protein product [Ambrosiozyma monospora]|uniref:Unnamed protein product n=1 Tax=Ambrosiozyma monospora TaxID=43982 RepID=A0ACB5T9S8_AMBMO|nr:unnamed protein product [Ambrosiozyma monospora]
MDSNDYNKLLKDINPDWSYKETKYLFDLAKRYDLRWAVIIDSYEYVPDEDEIKVKKEDEDKVDDKEKSKDDEKKETKTYTPRTVEDLKDQLYKVSSKLLNSKQDDGVVKDVALIKALDSFDKNKEIERKKYLNRLLHRAPTEIAEEESLVIEARKFELAAKKMLMERAQLLQLLDSPQSSAPIHQFLTSSGLTQLYNTLMTVDKSKKRKTEAPVAPQLGPNAIPYTQQLAKQQAAQQQAQAHKQQQQGGSAANSHHNDKKSQKQQHQQQQKPQSEILKLLQSRLTPEEMEVYGIKFHEEKVQAGVYLRSQKIVTFKPAVQSKVVEILNELGISMRLTMPTGAVCSKFDKLMHRIASLVDLKKQTDKIEAEVTLMKRQKGLL